MRCGFGDLNMNQAYGVAAEAAAVESAVKFVADGLALQIASLGRCGCVLLQNRNTNRQSVTLSSSWNGRPRGEFSLPWDERQPVDDQPVALIGFDNAGPQASDFYTVLVETAGAQAGAAAPPSSNVVGGQSLIARQHLRIVGILDDLACDASGTGAIIPIQSDGAARSVNCPFGSLRLDAFSGPGSAAPSDEVTAPQADPSPGAPTPATPGRQR